MNKLNIKNRTIFRSDNLPILEGINSNSIDLIYLDPPFNKNKKFTAPIGTDAEGASFKDIFREEDVKDEWIETIKEEHEDLYITLSAEREKSKVGKNIKENNISFHNYCYLVYMSIRLLEMKRILKDTGSIYYHCDSTMSHYIKVVMDCIFGSGNFRNEIVWRRTLAGKLNAKLMPNSVDIILYYSKSNNFKYNIQYRPLKDHILKSYKHKDNNGRFWCAGGDLTGNGKYFYEFNGVYKRWNLKKEKLQKLYDEGNIYITKNGNARKKIYLDNVKGTPINNFWHDINPINPHEKQHVGYPTQKPLALLERIIKASSNEGDVVLDAFCGCATTCVASEELNRQWIGIDISELASELVKKRISKGHNLFKGDWSGYNFDVTIIPKRDENDMNIEQGYFYIIDLHQKEGNDKVYKCGISKNIENRIKSYNTQSFKKPEVKLLLKSSNYKKIEKETIKNFGISNTGGTEFVTGDIETIVKFANSKK